MMLRYSFGLLKEAEAIENAVDDVLDQGLRTADIIGTGNSSPVTCTEMTEAILKAI